MVLFHTKIGKLLRLVKHLIFKILMVVSRYYITTAIHYTNGNPHIGHAYEIITADTIARYHRRHGRNVYFLTGTDEHGQKVAEKATEEGKEPIERCNYYSTKFQDLFQKLGISNDFFIRTTMPKHKVGSRFGVAALTRV